MTNGKDLIIRPAASGDIESILVLINSVDLPRSVFIKNDYDIVFELINQSFVALKADKLIGVLLMKGNYIDTIVTSEKGISYKLISVLPTGNYTTNISPNNIPSQKLFKKLGFKEVASEILLGEERILFEGEIH